MIQPQLGHFADEAIFESVFFSTSALTERNLQENGAALPCVQSGTNTLNVF
jgi:hypothetical protein